MIDEVEAWRRGKKMQSIGVIDQVEAWRRDITLSIIPMHGLPIFGSRSTGETEGKFYLRSTDPKVVFLRFSDLA